MTNVFKDSDYWNPVLPENLEKLAEELCTHSMKIVDSKGLKLAYHIPPAVARQIVLSVHMKAQW